MGRESKSTKPQRRPGDPVPWGSSTPPEFHQDSLWISEHIEELTDLYPDEWIAVVDGQVVAHGKDGSAVRREAFEKTGWHNFPMWLIETGRRLYSMPWYRREAARRR